MSDRLNEGFVLWFTGLPCSGKTTVADALADKLREKGRRVERLDGDIVRKSLTSDSVTFARSSTPRPVRCSE